MFKDFIKQQSQAEIYAVVSLCIFVFFFCLMLVLAFMQTRHLNHEISLIPLDKENDFHNLNSQNHV